MAALAHSPIAGYFRRRGEGTRAKSIRRLGLKLTAEGSEGESLEMRRINFPSISFREFSRNKCSRLAVVHSLYKCSEIFFLGDVKSQLYIFSGVFLALDILGDLLGKFFSWI